MAAPKVTLKVGGEQSRGSRALTVGSIEEPRIVLESGIKGENPGL